MSNVARKGTKGKGQRTKFDEKTSVAFLLIGWECHDAGEIILIV